METKANTTLIGLFTLAMIALAFGFVYWIKGGPGEDRKAHYVVTFTGSVGGLRVGSPVNFNGIRRGEVATIDLDPSNPALTRALIALDQNVALRKNMEITVETQALTGLAAVAIRGRPIRSDQELATLSAALQASERAKQEIIAPVTVRSPTRELLGTLPSQINSDASQGQDLIATAKEVMGQVNTLVTRLNTVIAQNEGPISDTMKNLNALSDSLNKSVDGQKLGKTLDDISKFSGALGDSSTDVKALIKNATEVSQKLNGLADKLDNVLAGFSGDANKGMFSEINAAAKSVRTLADKATRDIQALTSDGQRTLTEIDRAVRSFDKNPQRIIFGGSNVPEYNRR